VNLPEQIGQSLRTRGLLRRGQRLLVAVSGGVDSMALLHLLHRLAPKHGWKLTVSHFNHQLRGRSSDADERLVRQTAKKLGLPFVSGRAEVRQFARAEKFSIEMAARQLRHEFLARTARRLKIPTIALAHHADDQVELFFLRLLRGGGEGLAGMKWRSPSPNDVKVDLVRPFLNVSKAELDGFARENRIPFREDASNVSLDFRRNRIRRELLPRLRKHYSTALDQVVLRTMEILGAESELAGEAALAWLKKRRPVYEQLPVAVQRRVLQHQLRGREIAPSFDLIEQLREQAGVPVAVGENLAVARDVAGTLHLVRPARVAGRRPGLRQRRLSFRVGGHRSGTVAFAGATIRWRIEQQKAFRRPKPTAGREFFDADSVGERVVLRHWRAGDRFQPIGMPVAVKLQDLFVNAKMPRERRHEAVVATTAAGALFWVEGLRMGERFKLTAQTVRRLRWKWARGAS
jgi:tRNA(Ile)-lysidine synthase